MDRDAGVQAFTVCVFQITALWRSDTLYDRQFIQIIRAAMTQNTITVCCWQSQTLTEAMTQNTITVCCWQSQTITD